MLEKVIDLVSETIGVKKDALSETTGPGIIPEWDSIAQLNIVSALEEKFDLVLELDDILLVNSIGDIVNLLNGKGAGASIEPSTDFSGEISGDSTLDFSGLRIPEKILVGDGIVKNLGSFVSGKVLLVLGSENYSSKLKDKVISVISHAAENIFILHKESGEPTEDKISSLVSSLPETPDFIIGIGGGSVLDTSKLLYTKILFPENSLKDWRKNFSLPSPSKPITLTSIPTTHGSGAEVSSAAVFNNANRGKTVLLSHQFVCKNVVLDRQFLEGLPKKVAIDTTMDAFTHAIEGYLSTIEIPKVYPLVVESLSKIIKHLKSQRGIQDAIAGQDLLWASYLAGIVQNHCSVGLTHSISHQLSRYGVPHGRLNAIFLPLVLKFNYSNSKKKLDKLALDLGHEGGNGLIEFINGILDNYQIGNLGMNVDQKSVIEDLPTLVADIKEDITYDTTPYKISDEDLVKMLKKSLSL